MIIAIWAKGLRNVYDAYEVAMWLGYRERSWDTRRRLEHHLDEYLVWGGISEDEYRMLAIFDGRSEQSLSLSVPTYPGLASVPNGFLTVPGETAEKKLKNEIYQHTGIKGESEQLICLIGFMNGAFDCPWTSFTVIKT